MSDHHRLKNYCDLTTNEAKKYLQKAKEDGVDVIALTGGEPTIRKDIFNIIQFCKKLNFDKIELQTNGQMLSYKNFAKKMVEYGVTDVYTSFHAFSEPLQDFITQSKGSFLKSLQGLKNILKLDVRLQTNTVISKLNYRILNKLMVFFYDQGVKEVELDFLRPIGNALKYYDIVVPKKSDVSPYLEKALQVAENLGFDSIFVDDYPLCFMEKFNKYNADYLAMLQGLKHHDEQAFYYDAELNPIQIHENQKLKGPPCNNCNFKIYCEGDWKEYIEMNGWNEFKHMVTKGG
jgi:MoaA/NifB/PqqE/SkfB family radical SAM enzyme